MVLEEESLRDGLQFESQVVGLDDKVRIFSLLAKAGIKRIQVGSFVNPKVVRQMADTDDLVARIKDSNDVLITGLILNMNGLKRTLNCGLEHVSMSVSVSDTHSRRNVRQSAKEALDSMVKLIREAVSSGLVVRGGVQCAFGCVYEGKVPEKRVLDTLYALAEAGAEELNLADTTGMANPLSVQALVKQTRKAVPGKKVSLHLHDTRGLGLANMVAGYEAGTELFDVSAGGLGGCPFVRGASGNVATEDAVNLFEEMGVDTGIDIPTLCEAVEAYESILGRKLPGKMCRVQRAQPNL